MRKRCTIAVRKCLLRKPKDKITSEVTEISTCGLYSVRTKKGELISPGGDEADASKSSSPYLLSKISIADLLEKVKGIPIINEIFSKDVAQKLNVSRSKGDLSPMLRFSISEEIPSTLSAEDQNLLFDADFYERYENESHEPITETVEELEAAKASEAFATMSDDEAFDLNAKLKAKRAGCDFERKDR